jgi:hypothetical protein
MKIIEIAMLRSLIFHDEVICEMVRLMFGILFGVALAGDPGGFRNGHVSLTRERKEATRGSHYPRETFEEEVFLF